MAGIKIKFTVCNIAKISKTLTLKSMSGVVLEYYYVYQTTPYDWTNEKA